MHSLFFSYSHKDEALRNQLEVQLTMLRRQGIISVWHDRRLLAGDHIDQGISIELASAHIILLLVSPDFLASEYCYSTEMRRALERHKEGSARVIPVILRPCEWQQAPFGKLLATPTDGKPVTKWPDLDDAFLEVTKAIRAAAEATVGKKPAVTHAPAPAPSNPQYIAQSPRSSNLRMRQTFTEHDTDVFLEESFEFMARFFENSLEELKARNILDMEAAFKRIDANRFTATVYRDGAALSRCQIRLGGQFGKGITFSQGSMNDNSINESLSIHTDDQSLGLKTMGMPSFGSYGRNSNLTQEGAAEYYWDLFVRALQQQNPPRRL